MDNIKTDGAVNCVNNPENSHRKCICIHSTNSFMAIFDNVTLGNIASTENNIKTKNKY